MTGISLLSVCTLVNDVLLSGIKDNMASCITTFHLPVFRLVGLILRTADAHWLHFGRCQLDLVKYSSNLVMRQVAVSQICPCRHYIKKRNVSSLTVEEKFILRVRHFYLVTDFSCIHVQLFAYDRQMTS
jgi:hypothetical protein